MENLDFYISKNGRYMMLENMIYDKVNDASANFNELKFSVLIDIIGENMAFLSKDVKTDLKEISSFTRKTAYHVVECFTETDDKLSLMMEYEVKFGSSLLTESVVNPEKLVLETWGWIKEQALILEYWGEEYVNKAVGAVKSAGNYVAGKAKDIGKGIVSTAKAVGNAALHPIDTLKAGAKWVGAQVMKGYEWVKNSSFDVIMETIREGLYSGIGTAIQIFLQFTGVGNVAVAIVWGCMLLWDLYKIFTGKKWEWSDILFDVLGIISGAAVKALKGAMKAVGITKGMSMGKGLQTLAANPATKGFMATISKGISGVFNMIKSAGNWLAKNLGLKWVGDVVAKAGTWLNTYLIKPIATGAGKLVTGANNLVKGTRNLADKALQKTGNIAGLKNVGNKTLSKANKVTVGSAARKGTVGGAEYKLKQNYVYDPAIEQGTKIYDKVRGVNPVPVPSVASVNTYGLADDVSDQLDAAFG